jgi:diphthine methyl ester synthase
MDGMDGPSQTLSPLSRPNTPRKHHSATTHTDLQLRARQRGIPVTTIPNASALTAVGACGLSLYRFGGAVSLVFFTDTWRPDSWYDRIASNRAAGLHTLCLLDIKVKEPTLASLARGGRPVYEPPRFMSAAVAAAQLLEVEETRVREGRPCGAYSPDTLVVGLARLGAGADQTIVAAPLQEMATADLGPPLHCLVIPAPDLTDIEAEALEAFKGRVPVLSEGGGGEEGGSGSE